MAGCAPPPPLIMCLPTREEEVWLRHKNEAVYWSGVVGNQRATVVALVIELVGIKSD